MSNETEALKQFFAAINRNDMQAVTKDFDPQIERIEPEGFPSAGSYRGLTEVQEHIAKGRGTWAEGACEPEKFLVNGDRVVVYLHAWVHLKDSTDWVGGRFADGFVFRNGKITQWLSFGERAEALKWAGIEDQETSEGTAMNVNETKQTVYEALGGHNALLRLASAWHNRVLADEVVSHAFSHGYHPQHTERLAAYWAEALGGPTMYSDRYGSETSVVQIHSGNGPHEEMDQRAIACFDQALEDVGLGRDDHLRRVLHDYFAWATTTTMARYPDSAEDVPDGLQIPKWSWNGRVSSGEVDET
jgi:truncated hemoglobin YjbI/ketosteroid isomerase-like protein